MAEFKLSYTATEIDKKLGKVSKLTEDTESLFTNVGSLQTDVDVLNSDVGGLQVDIQTKAEIVTLTTAEYEELENAGTTNANALYMITDGDEEVIQSDWNQADSNSFDFIKNRTHYEEPVWEVVSEERTLNFTPNSGAIAAFCPVQPEKAEYIVLSAVNGDIVNIRVVFDGVTYDIKNDPTVLLPFYGNLSLLPDPAYADKDSGEPFCIAVDYELFICAKTEGEHTISISYQNGTTVHQLDQKFIPNADWNASEGETGYIKNKPNVATEDEVLLKSEQTLTDDELTQVRNNLKFIGKNVTGQSFIIDGKTVVASDSAEIFGDYSTNIATGQWSIAEGSGTVAKGRASHAEGAYSKALNDGCHVEGYQTEATGYWSHAEGEMTRVTSYASHAEGSYCTLPNGTKRYGTAAGYASHIEGGGCHATGSCSHAEGLATTVSGAQSHAEGRYTIAAGGAQHVEGIANIEDAEGKYIHIAGNGAFDARSNAHHLDWDGNAWFAGDVYVGSTSGTNKDEGSVKLQKSITGTPGQFVVIGDDGNVTTKTIGIAEEASF